MTTSVVGRQPIVDRELSLIGYELLFRSLVDSESAFANITGPRIESPDLGDAMSTTVFFSTMDIGIRRIVGDKLMFCNADRGGTHRRRRDHLAAGADRHRSAGDGRRRR